MRGTLPRILITGANGFLGSTIADFARAKGFEVGTIARDDAYRSGVVGRSYKVDDMAASLEAFRPDIVVHAAGASSVTQSIQAPEKARCNAIGPLTGLLDGIRQSSVEPHVLFISSAAVYGNSEIVPLPETAPLRPISPYGEHKLECERLLDAFSRSTGAPVTIARAFSVFGERQRRLLIWDLFRKFREEDVVSLHGTGDEERDFLYAETFADRILGLAQIEAGCGTVNVAQGIARTVRHVAASVGQCLKSEKPIVFSGEQRQGDPSRWQADISRLQELLCLEQTDNFRTSLEKIIWAWQ